LRRGDPKQPTMNATITADAAATAYMRTCAVEDENEDEEENLRRRQLTRWAEVSQKRTLGPQVRKKRARSNQLSGKDFPGSFYQGVRFFRSADREAEEIANQRLIKPTHQDLPRAQPLQPFLRGKLRRP